jgi:uncharacterized delta-60 repeat protein
MAMPPKKRGNGSGWGFAIAGRADCRVASFSATATFTCCISYCGESSTKSSSPGYSLKKTVQITVKAIEHRVVLAAVAPESTFRAQWIDDPREKALKPFTYLRITLSVLAIFLAACTKEGTPGNPGGNPGRDNANFSNNSKQETGLTAFRSTNGVGNRIIPNSDGSFLLFGTFNAYADAASRRGMVRILANGNLDPDFKLGRETTVRVTSLNSISVAQTNDKNIYVAYGGGYANVGLTPSKVVKIKPTYEIDDTYASAATGLIRKIAAQSDGRVLYIEIPLSDTSPVLLKRLRPNGALDTTFSPVSVLCTGSAEYMCPLIVGPGDEIYVRYASGIVRLNADGQIEPSFVSPTLTGTTGLYLSGGKLYLFGSFASVSGSARNGLARVDAKTGALDDIFAGTGPQVGTSAGQVTSVFVKNDKIVVAGNFTAFNGFATTNVALFNSGGVIDKTFSASATMGSRNGTAPLPYYVILDGLGYVYLTGNFTSVDSFPCLLARLKPTGEVDKTFARLVTEPWLDGTASAVKHLSTGKILIAGSISAFNGTTFDSAPGKRMGLIRVNSDGGLDTTFSSDFTTTAVKPRILEASDGTTYVVDSLPRRILSSGKVDTTYSATVPVASVSGYYVIADIQPTTNRIVAATTSDNVNYQLVRYNNSGAKDSTFSINLDGTAVALSFQKDGTFLVQTSKSLTRYSVTGSIDTNFVGTGVIGNYVLQPDPTDVKRWYGIGLKVTRYNATGLDTTFAPKVGFDTNLLGHKATVLADGRILAVGDAGPFSASIDGVLYEGAIIIDAAGAITKFPAPFRLGERLSMDSFFVGGKLQLLAVGQVEAFAGPTRSLANVSVSESFAQAWK